MGLMQRRKGKRGEREAAALLRKITGLDVQRRVRQHDGDSDLIGLGEWVIEVKVAARVTAAIVDKWWQQAIDQTSGAGTPLLMYRQDRQPWRCRWFEGCGHWVEGTPEAWWDISRGAESWPSCVICATPTLNSVNGLPICSPGCAAKLEGNWAQSADEKLS